MSQKYTFSLESPGYKVSYEETAIDIYFEYMCNSLFLQCNNNNARTAIIMFANM